MALLPRRPTPMKTLRSHDDLRTAQSATSLTSLSGFNSGHNHWLRYPRLRCRGSSMPSGGLGAPEHGSTMRSGAPLGPPPPPRKQSAAMCPTRSGVPSGANSTPARPDHRAASSAFGTAARRAPASTPTRPRCHVRVRPVIGECSRENRRPPEGVGAGLGLGRTRGFATRCPHGKGCDAT